MGWVRRSYWPRTRGKSISGFAGRVAGGAPLPGLVGVFAELAVADELVEGRLVGREVDGLTRRDAVGGASFPDVGFRIDEDRQRDEALILFELANGAVGLEFAEFGKGLTVGAFGLGPGAVDAVEDSRVGEKRILAGGFGG